VNLRGNASLDFNAELLENFTWDGLALVKRDSTNFVNESAVTGGNPILAFGKDSSKVLFEDMLGSSVGSVENDKFNAINRTAFGESNSDSELNFFTGKPQVEGLGYAFLFRNYRADQSKWQTQDPLGYPDGWNNLAYCSNMVTNSIDWRGGETIAGVSYVFLRWEYVCTYAIVSFHNGEDDGSNITSILWEQKFNVYKPVYSATCVDSTCKDYNKFLGEVIGSEIAGPAYNSSGSSSGNIIVQNSGSIPGAPSSPTGFYYKTSKGVDSYPSVPSSTTAQISHTHRPE
jgi:RHS repeat-associated protein